MSEETQVLFGELRDRMLRLYPQEVRECLAKLTDDRIWWRPHAAANSVGNLVLHLTGNLNHYLGRGVMGSGYRRNRPAEFSETGPVPREDLMRGFESAMEAARQAFDQCDEKRLLDTADLGPESMPIGQLLVAVTTHFSNHVGQIVYVTKMLHEGVFDEELWQRVRER